jgi:methyl-accepting chemotaxis protein
MKINKMPTTLVLLVMSWLVAILGLAASGYILIRKGNDMRLLLVAFIILFASLLLAALARMAGIMGQVLFNLRMDIQELSKSPYQDTKQTQDILSKGFSSLSQDLKTQLQEQASNLIKTLQELSKSLSQDTKQTQDILSKGFSSLSQDLKTQPQEQASSLIRTLQELSKSLSQDTKQTQDILSKGFSSLSQDLKTQLQEQAASLIKTLQELNKNLTVESGEVKKSIEQINLNAKNINQNIDKIKSFFEQIERHLDLKK